MSWTVERVMTREVAWVPPDAAFRTILRLLRARSVTAVPVVSAGVVVGVVSEGDLLTKLDGTGPKGRREVSIASELMTAPPITVAPQAAVAEAARLMERAGVKRLPVVDPEGRLLGIVSRGDLLKVFLRPDAAIHEEVATLLRKTLWMGEPDVMVKVVGGAVELKGSADTRDLAESAAELARSVPGVVAVHSLLTYKAGGRRLDEEDLTPLARRFSAGERQRL